MDPQSIFLIFAYSFWAAKNETSQKLRQLDFFHKPHKPGARRPHISGIPTPPTSIFIPPNRDKTTVHGPSNSYADVWRYSI
jgi:hypothetical protein